MVHGRTRHTHAPTHELAMLAVLMAVAAGAHVAVQRPLGAAMLRLHAGSAPRARSK